MKLLTILSAVDQVAGHLREEILQGRVSGVMVGVHPLAEELGVNHKTVRAALRQLESEGLLVDQGRGLQRRIVLPRNHTSSVLRVAILLYDSKSENVLNELRHLLENAGHAPFVTDKTLQDFGMNVSRVGRYVMRTEADAWVVVSGSQDLLSWFADRDVPAFALAGRRREVAIAGVGPDKVPIMAEATRRLIALGHRRISKLCRRQVRLPQPAKSVEAYRNELELAGIVTSDFNLPNWQESRDGFERVLDSLFGGLTPPTALILDEPYLYYAAHHYLAGHGLRVPQDVSLICTDDDPGFIWCKPSVAHIRWDYRPVLRRTARWVDNVASGKCDRRQSFTKAEFIEGGTIGPAPKGR